MKYFILTYLGKPLGDSGESCKTNYIFSEACDVCGTGAKVEKELHTKGIEKTGKNFFQTVDGDYIISANLCKTLIAENVRIGTLKNVVSYRNKAMPYFHFATDINLPKAFERRGLITENQCPVCKRNGFFNDVTIGNLEKNIPTKVSSLELAYKNVEFSFLAKSDIFNTWEHIGLSNRKAEGKWVVRYARPLVVVSETLKNVLEKNGVKELHFDEIKLI